ncbi:hypothetical protein [Pseudotabrizicola algicola]|uniref:hypothetical protein n=1 Tax=Pseudotabrizicola algicola TaxID=2709381 RepID=UPI001967C60C|nr:hypothetical protein [Pseudotabrizicola algicola]
MSPIIRLRRVALVALLALALGIIGFGHRTPSQQDAALQGFLTAGFALPDLCGSLGDDPSGLHDPCPVCTLAGSALVPADVSHPRAAELRMAAAVFGPAPPRAVVSGPDPAHAPRAPPLA